MTIEDLSGFSRKLDRWMISVLAEMVKEVNFLAMKNAGCVGLRSASELTFRPELDPMNKTMEEFANSLAESGGIFTKERMEELIEKSFELPLTKQLNQMYGRLSMYMLNSRMI